MLKQTVLYLTSLFVWAGRLQPLRFQERWENRRKRDRGWRRRQTMSAGPWLRRFGTIDHPTLEGVGAGLSPLSVPQSQMHSWYLPQKSWQWLASGQQPTPTPPPHIPTTIPPPRSCPSTWLRRSQCVTLPPPQNAKKAQQSDFSGPSQSPSELATKFLCWHYALYNIVSDEAGGHLMLLHTQHL